MSYKEDLDKILETLKTAVEDHLTREQVRIDGLVAKIQEAAQQIRVVNAKDDALLLEITSAARELQNYNPVTIFGTEGGKRSRRSNRRRKTIRK